MGRQVIIDPEWDTPPVAQPAPAADDPVPFDPDPAPTDIDPLPPVQEPVAPPPPDPFTVERPAEPSSAEKWLADLISGGFLSRKEVRRAYPFLLLIAFLMLLYISGQFRMQQLHRTENNLQRQVKELRALSLELAAKRMDSTRRSKIMEDLERRGIPLIEPVEPPKIIEH